MKKTLLRVTFVVFALIACLLSSRAIRRELRVSRSSVPEHRASLSAASSVPSADRKRVALTLGSLPLSFEENIGSTDPHVNFLARGPGYAMYLGATEAVLAHQIDLPIKKLGPSAPAVGNETDGNRPSSIIRLKWLGANPDAKPLGVGRQNGTSNYFIGNQRDKWRTRVAHFDRVRSRNLYPGIDLLYHGNHRDVEFDYEVAAGADPSTIRVGVEAPGPVKIDRNGRLSIGASSEHVGLLPPVAYQEENGAHTFVSARYVMAGLREVRFKLGAYDHGKPLIIDPVLSYAASWGSATDRSALTSVAVDAQGNAYVTGSTCDTDYPVTPSAFQASGGSTNPVGCGSVVVSKLDSTASTLLYSTYVGGANGDSAGARIVVNEAGEAYVGGVTTASDFPTSATAFQKTAKGGTCDYTPAVTNQPCTDGILFKLSADGASLAFSTLLGGERMDSIAALALDGSNNIYVTGATNSASFPVRGTPLQGTYGGGICSETGLQCFDAFVAKFNPDGSSLIASTYLGGSGNDYGIGIFADAAGDAYVAGNSASLNFPTTPQALQKARAGSAAEPDAFVTKMDGELSKLRYSTLIGGSGSDLAFGLQVDSSGSAYIAGSTASPDFPMTAGAFQLSYSGPVGVTCFNTIYSIGQNQRSCGDAFVAKLDTSGSALVFSTYLGGSGNDVAFNLALDSFKNIWLTGNTNSPDFPYSVSAPYQASGNAPQLFLSELAADGANVLFSTPLVDSSAGDSVALGLAIDPFDSVYVIGKASQFTPTAGSLTSTTGGGLFAMKFAPGPDRSPFSALTRASTAPTVAATTTALTGTPAPSLITQSVTFTAKVGSSSAGTPTGSVKFFDGNTQIGMGALNTQAVATFTTSVLAKGLHFITAKYPGDANFANSSSAKFTQIVNPPASSTTLTSSQNPAMPGQSVTITAGVTSASPGTPTGAITFFDGAMQLGLAIPLDAQGNAALNTSVLAQGTHSITAKYSGDLNFSPSMSVPLNQVILSNTTTTLTPSPNPSTTGQSVTIAAAVTSASTGTPTGTVTFFDGATQIGSPVILDAQGKAALVTSLLAIGTHSITAKYSGDPNFSPSMSVAFNQVILANTATTLTSSQNPSMPGVLVTIAAAATSANSGTPTGTVTFFDGATQIGSPVILDAQGKAALATSLLAIGTHSITAKYSGDPNFSPSTSAMLTQTVMAPPDFTVAATPAQLVLSAGEAGSVTFTVTPQNGSTQTISFACVTPPPNATCSFAPQSLILDGAHPASAKATIATTSRGSIAPKPISTTPFGPLGLLFATLGVCSVILFSRMAPRRILAAGAAIALVVVALALTSCSVSSGSPGSSGTPAGTYNVVVNATAASGGSSHPSTVTVIVR